MRKNRISETIGNINPKYVNEAISYTGEVKTIRRPIWMKWGAVAACLCLVVVIVTLPDILGDYPRNDGALTAIENKDRSIIANFKIGHASACCYPVPAPGEYFCFTEVSTARKEYADKDVVFLLSFDVFNDSGEEMSIEELTEEYQRLADLGYKLYYVEDHWTYYGDNQKEYIPIVVGLFTEEELSTFKASDQYGYTFYFETNGDNSAISVNEENVVTDFNSLLY